jgi:phosphoenolpyruvate-protein kinase (PTS system EI component)
MAGIAANVELLLGLGLFSVAPSQLLEVKSAIRGVRIDEAERLARRVLELDTADAIEALVEEAPARGLQDLPTEPPRRVVVAAARRMS